MYYIPSDRSFLQLSNGIGHVMPSTDRKLELTAEASMAQPVSQTAVCSNGLKHLYMNKFPCKYNIEVNPMTASPYIYMYMHMTTKNFTQYTQK